MTSFNRELRDKVNRLETELRQARGQLLENARTAMRELEEKMTLAWAARRNMDRTKDVFDLGRQETGQWYDFLWKSSKDLDVVEFSDGYGLTEDEAQIYRECYFEVVIDRYDHSSNVFVQQGIEGSGRST